MDENAENKYKRKKSKNNENFLITKNNDKEMNIPVNKFFSNEKETKENNNRDNPNNLITNPTESRFRNLMKSTSKEKQRSLSNKNNKSIKNYNNKDQTHQNILTEENSEGIKNLEKKGEEKIDDVYIINKFFKSIELKNYPYNRIIAKKIKLIFKSFSENRTEFLLNNKINGIKEDEDSDYTEQSNAAYKKKQTVPIEKLKNKLYYEKFKQRVMNQLENEMTFKPELNTSTNHSNIVTVVSNKRRNLKMEDAYDYQKKKRER